MEDPLFILVVLAVLAVGVVLAIGLAGFAKGGEFNRKYANIIMRVRIVGQAVAVGLILLYIYLRQGSV